MPTISNSVSVAANARSANILAGEPFEFITRPAVISFFANGAVTGLETDVLVGGRSVAVAADLPATNRVPLREEDGVVQFAAAPGERLFVTLLNTTGAAIIARWIVDINFVG